MRRSIRFVGLAAALAVALAAAVLGAPAAQAATCSGSSCFNKDPQGTGCNSGTKTLTTISATGSVGQQVTSNITAELRWTGSCGHVAWLRTAYMPSGGPMPAFRVEACGGTNCSTHYVIDAPWGDSSWPHCSQASGGGCSTPFWTDMVPTGGMVVRICGAATQTQFSNDTFGPTTHGPWGCSAWY